MSNTCDYAGCYPDGPCAYGEVSKSACRHFGKLPDGTRKSDADVDSSSMVVAWNGQMMGSDLSLVAARTRPIVIGILGPHEAGKTTFLLGVYQALLSGAQLAKSEFAGSFTLAAWEELAMWSRPSIGRPGRFPPRTSASSLASAGLLHVAVRGKELLRDILFTDAPGEWFQSWAIAPDSAEAEGARWVAHNADAFMVFADCEKLAGATRGQARGEVSLLLERVASVCGARPVSVVWSKSDCIVPGPIRDAVLSTQKRWLPHSIEANCTYRDPKSLLETASGIISLALRGRYVRIKAHPIIEPRPFFAFRGHNEVS